MLKKKGVPSFKPKAGIRRNVPVAASRQSKTPAPAAPSAAPSESPVETPVAPASDITPATDARVSTAPSSTASAALPSPAPTAATNNAPSSQLQAAEPSVVTVPPKPVAIPEQAGRAETNAQPEEAPQRITVSATAVVDAQAQHAGSNAGAAGLVPPSRALAARAPEPPVTVEQTPVVHAGAREELATATLTEQAPPHALPTPASTATPSASEDLPIDPAITSSAASSQSESVQRIAPQGRKRKAPASAEESGATGSTVAAEGPSPSAASARKRRATKSQSTVADAAAGEAVSVTADGERGAAPAPQPRKRPAARKNAKAAAAAAQDGADAGVDGAPNGDTAAPRSRARAKRPAKSRTTAGGIDGAAEDVTAEGTPANPRRRKQAAAGAAATDVEAEGIASETNEAAGTKKNRAASRRPRQERSATPEDAEEQVIDPNSLTMAELTKDLRIGKKFSRHDELRDRMKELSAKQREERRLRKLNGGTGSGEDGAPLAGGDGPGAQVSGTGTDGSLVPAARPVAVLGPQFEIINGEIVINQASLVHDRHAEAMADQADMEEVEENDFTRMTNSATYLRPNKLRGPNAWNKEETAQFYDYLRMFGTDFQTIANMFPGRTRRHVKMKFNREERHNPAGVNAALVGRKEVMIDLDEYQTRTGRELEATEAIEAEYRQRQEAHEAEQRRIQEEADALQAEKRKKLLGLGPGDDEAAKAKKDEPTGASKTSSGGAAATAAADPDEDVEIIDEEEEAARPPPPRRKRRGGGIGG